jgi:ATP-dependent DNA ligase
LSQSHLGHGPSKFIKQRTHRFVTGIRYEVQTLAELFEYVSAAWDPGGSSYCATKTWFGCGLDDAFQRLASKEGLSAVERFALSARTSRRASQAQPRRRPPAREWLHEIKHDGFRVIARKEGTGLRLYSRPGNDLTDRVPLIVEALAKLRPRSCIIDGEAVACGEDGIASLDRIRYRHHDASVFLYAFDLVELKGDDLRRDPLAVRKATLASLLARAAPGCGSTSTWTKRMAHSCSRTPASLGSKASCRSAGTPPIAPGARRTGSRAKTQRHRR